LAHETERETAVANVSWMPFPPLQESFETTATVILPSSGIAEDLPGFCSRVFYDLGMNSNLFS
jgi:hypothetical protein